MTGKNVAVTMNECDADDPIVVERNVYLSNHISQKLFCLNYTSRFSDRPYETRGATTKVKPNVPKLEFHIPLVDEYVEYFQDSEFNLVLSSRKPNTDSQNCAFGVYVNDEFHLCSLPEVLEMKPDLKTYLSKTVKEESEDEDSGNETATLVTPKVANKASDAEKTKLLASYEYMKNKEDKEPWVDVVSRPAETYEFSMVTYQSTTTNPTSEFYMTPEDYYELLIPPLKGQSSQTLPKKKNLVNASQNNNINASSSSSGQVIATLSEEELIKFADEKLKSRTLISLQELHMQFNMDLGAFYSKKTKQQLEDALVKAGGIKMSSSRSNPVYAVTAKGDKRDPIRDCLVHVLLTKPVVKMSYFKGILEKNGLGSTPEPDLKLVLKEYCTTKGGSWISKAHSLEEDNSKIKKSR